MDERKDGPDEVNDNGQDGGQDREMDPGLSLHMKLGGAGEPVEPDYSAQAQAGSGRVPERDEDIDTGVALHMKLGGAGDPVRPDGAAEDDGESGGSSIEGSRLCPGCNRVTEFSGGTCPECGFQFRSAGAPPAFDAGPGLDAQAGGQVMKILAIVVLVAVLAFAVSRMDFSSMGSGGQQATTGSEIEDPFIAVGIDDAFHTSLTETLQAEMDAWQEAGVDAYVYRYRVHSSVEPGVSQYIRVTAFVGGDDAQAAVTAPGDEPLRKALATYLRSYNDKQGLEYELLLTADGGPDSLEQDDHYVRWGYDYGREHIAEVWQVTDAIDSYRERESQYPRTLAGVAANMKLENRGFSYTPGGWGYLPIFATNSSGVVPFGSGSASAELYPREITGYYLVRYLPSPNMGVDLLGEAGKGYYLNRISPLPCVQKSELRNVPIEPDGEPDGIAWVVKNGELLDV